jgi:hypothetical protein
VFSSAVLDKENIMFEKQRKQAQFRFACCEIDSVQQFKA